MDKEVTPALMAISMLANSKMINTMVKVATPTLMVGAMSANG